MLIQWAGQDEAPVWDVELPGTEEESPVLSCDLRGATVVSRKNMRPEEIDGVNYT